MPRLELRLLDDRQLDWPRRPTGCAPARDRQDSADDRPALVAGRGSIDEGEDVEVAGRSKAAPDGRAVQVRADERFAEDVAKDADNDLAESILFGAPAAGDLAGGASVDRRLSDGRCPRSRAG
ncbi:MAG TPA: hypothetical protein VL749_11545 [Patescibacteria group bacterium]|jgi:hypothetical protein|nr:hypothetical protein [Patescibacteria group bacterium]